MAAVCSPKWHWGGFFPIVGMIGEGVLEAWCDEFALRVGDSLRQERNSRLKGKLASFFRHASSETAQQTLADRAMAGS